MLLLNFCFVLIFQLVEGKEWTLGVLSPQSPHLIGRFLGARGLHRVEGAESAVLQEDKCFDKDEPEHPPPG